VSGGSATINAVSSNVLDRQHRRPRWSIGNGKRS
jgi:hypothetical protein